MSLRLVAPSWIISVVCGHAPHEAASVEDKDSFWTMLGGHIASLIARFPYRAAVGRSGLQRSGG